MAETLGELQDRASRLAATVERTSEQCTELSRELEKLDRELRTIEDDPRPPDGEAGMEAGASTGFHLGMWWPALIVVVLIVLAVNSVLTDDSDEPTELAGVVLDSASPDARIGAPCTIVVTGVHRKGAPCSGAIRCAGVELFRGLLACEQEWRLDGEGEDASTVYTLSASALGPSGPARIEVDDAVVTVGEPSRRVTIILEREITESEARL